MICWMCSVFDPQHPPKMVSDGMHFFNMAFSMPKCTGLPRSSSVASSSSAWLFHDRLHRIEPMRDSHLCLPASSDSAAACTTFEKCEGCVIPLDSTVGLVYSM